MLVRCMYGIRRSAGCATLGCAHNLVRARDVVFAATVGATGTSNAERDPLYVVAAYLLAVMLDFLPHMLKAPLRMLER